MSGILYFQHGIIDILLKKIRAAASVPHNRIFPLEEREKLGGGGQASWPFSPQPWRCQTQSHDGILFVEIEVMLLISL
jgi:hypothetical protein